MESIFNVIDIWFNVIPHIDYRTFSIIKRLNKAIYRDCHIKRKPLVDDFKNWSFTLKQQKEDVKPIVDDSGWKTVKQKTNKKTNHQAVITYIKRVKEMEHN